MCAELKPARHELHRAGSCHWVSLQTNLPRGPVREGCLILSCVLAFLPALKQGSHYIQTNALPPDLIWHPMKPQICVCVCKNSICIIHVCMYIYIQTRSYTLFHWILFWNLPWQSECIRESLYRLARFSCCCLAQMVSTLLGASVFRAEHNSNQFQSATILFCSVQLCSKYVSICSNLLLFVPIWSIQSAQILSTMIERKTDSDWRSWWVDNLLDTSKLHVECIK